MKRLILVGLFVAACIYYPGKTARALWWVKGKAFDIAGKVGEVVETANELDTVGDTTGEGGEGE